MFLAPNPHPATASTTDTWLLPHDCTEIEYDMVMEVYVI